MGLNRYPKVKNKYDLTISKVKKLKVLDRSKIKEPLFWRNEVINAWCISENAGTEEDVAYGTDNEYWIGIYDLNAKNYGGKFRFTFSSYGGMCGYNFKRFFDPSEIENDVDLEIQEKFLRKINKLIDMGILGME